MYNFPSAILFSPESENPHNSDKTGVIRIRTQHTDGKFLTRQEYDTMIRRKKLKKIYNNENNS